MLPSLNDENLSVVLLSGMLSTAAGGLAFSVPFMSRALESQRGTDVHVMGLRDPNASEEELNWGSSVIPLNYLGPRAFGYTAGIARELERISPSLVDVQGIWTYQSLANLNYCKRHNTPYIITPHGMLDLWARNRSAIKKRLVRLWFEDEHLTSATCLRATAELEADHFRSFGLTNPIAIIPNGIHVPDLLPRNRPRSAPRRILFLSRLHPKKGLWFLVKAWASIAHKRPDWELVIAGPDELNHRAEMQSLARNVSAPRITWMEAVHGSAKNQLYRSSDLFVLPTHAENFGLVVAEALANEVPVITTRNAPWGGLRDFQCGWWIDLNLDALTDALLDATNTSREELSMMGARGRDWVSSEFRWDSVAERLQEVYLWAAKGASRPSHVYLA